MTQLDEIVQREVAEYSGPSLKATTYAIFDHEQRIYAVVSVPDQPRKFHTGVIVMARVADDRVLIDEDITDRPLVDALVQAGIAREKIVLVYAGEDVPERLT